MVAASRSRTRAEAAAEKRTTRSAAAATSAVGRNDENVNAKAATAASASGSNSKLASTSSSPVKSKAAVKKSQTPVKPKSSVPAVSATATNGSVAARRKSVPKEDSQEVVVGGEVFCSCKGPDDGSPMIKCDGTCNMWYHLRCIGISEDDASEIGERMAHILSFDLALLTLHPRCIFL
ncbi:hypothetical protein SCHPADRAFT_403407 [Schizopora paradoxa]|uniref:PHD-type domain-containing protein n=1 Tax=Schizopora paradoxa TaxID=27342 RepID=A0A0H2S791_9AGAM|nr:hypothetical protein SCHPADRAFT_403407 [Schizopora paradoxa]